MRQPGGLGTNPAWFHETLMIPLGATEYRFSTLSLYDVWVLWPHLRALHAYALAKRPLSMIESAREVLAWLAPVLAKNEADCAALSADPDKINLLLDFYRRQDWTRMEQLGEKTTPPAQEPTAAPEHDPHDVFVAVVALGAQHAGMPLTDFVRQRFEFCADQILAANRALGRAQPTEERSSWQTVFGTIARHFGPPQRLDPDKLPEWLRNVKIDGQPS